MHGKEVTICKKCRKRVRFVMHGQVHAYDVPLYYLKTSQQKKILIILKVSQGQKGNFGYGIKMISEKIWLGAIHK